MSDGPVKVNGHLPDGKPSGTPPNGTPNVAPTSSQPKRPRKKRGPNYNQIHSKPLPLDVHPLPAFHPSHPTSLLRICYVWLSQLIFLVSSHPPSRYTCYFSEETRSIHVTHPVHVRALWEMGFFGKGSLSRSEPSWLQREKARLVAERSGGTAEEATNARREERRLFKLERARLEREKIERQRAVEEGRMTAEEAATIDVQISSKDDEITRNAGPTVSQQQQGLLVSEDMQAEPRHPQPTDTIPMKAADAKSAPGDEAVDELDEAEPDVTNQEHLQLTLEEAFFLSHGLGVIDIIVNGSPDQAPKSSADLLSLFSRCSSFVPTANPNSVPPDNPFLLNYVVYHHFRSLGWVVRPGMKFAVDYVLYNRGPVFSHAEFAVVIVPSYTHHYWQTETGKRERRIKEQKDWWWLHCVNRVQSQVKKTLVLAYVDIPSPLVIEQGNVGALLKRFKVREFVVRRWLPNRSRG